MDIAILVPTEGPKAQIERLEEAPQMLLRSSFWQANKKRVKVKDTSEACSFVPSLTTSTDLNERLEIHTELRVMYFWLYAVALYGEGIGLRVHGAFAQYNSANEEHMAAAHSNLMGVEEVNTAEVLRQELSSWGIHGGNIYKFRALGVPRALAESYRDKELTDAEVDDLLQHVQGQDQLLGPETHLFHVSNSTVVVPPKYNGFDDTLENRLRPLALDILQQCSMGDVTPDQAASIFCRRYAYVLKEIAIKDRALRQYRVLQECALKALRKCFKKTQKLEGRELMHHMLGLYSLKLSLLFRRYAPNNELICS